MAQGNAGVDARWLTEAQVADLVTLNDAIDALAVGFADEDRGAAQALGKALGTWEGGAMHALGAHSVSLGRAGFKTWVHTQKGASAVFSLFDMSTGALLAVLEAATLGQIRTSAVSGLAARLLAPEGADELALIGTGAQAMTQIAAVAAVRPLKRVRIFSRTPEKRADFARRTCELFDFDVVDCASMEEAVDGAPIVTLITRGTEPFMPSALIADGTLVIAAGAILPTTAECFPELVARAGTVVVDSLPNAKANSRELRERFGDAEAPGWDAVRTLGRVLNDAAFRPDASGPILFKPMGTGLSDLVVAASAHARAESGGIGSPIAQPIRVTPKWRAA